MRLPWLAATVFQETKEPNESLEPVYGSGMVKGAYT